MSLVEWFQQTAHRASPVEWFHFPWLDARARMPGAGVGERANVLCPMLSSFRIADLKFKVVFEY